ncbi:MAG: hydroxymethylglutaryl-CoA lyase [Pseudomonadota bacterium]
MSDRITIVEVGPRDGLQNEPTALSLATKVALIDRLTDAGLPAIEAGAFVSPKWVPQMADSAAVFAAIDKRPGVRYPTLVPNARGMADAIAAGVQEVAIFGAASETFSQRNINCSIAESLSRFAEVAAMAAEADVRLRGYISCVLGCPYEGVIDPGKVGWVAGELVALGCREISLGDTIGVGTPGKAASLIRHVAETVPTERLAAHFHDTYGQALANLYAAFEEGVRIVDSSIAGLGGCPYAKGASGNVATEDVVYMAQGLGLETGVDMDRLLNATRFVVDAIGRPPVSKAAQALLAKAG